jgi:hypothetical protein
LNIGDTLTATFKFIPSGIPQAGSSSQGFRFGLFDFADGNNNPKRVSGDGFGSSSQGSSVAGYALFGKFYGKFSDATPIDIRKRINLSDASLLGTSGDFTSLAKDSLTTNSFGGFANPPTNNTLAFFNAQAALTDTNLFGTNPYLTLGGSTLTVGNDLNLGGASTLNLALGTNATEIAVAGILVLNGTLNFAASGGFTAATYTLFTYGGTLTCNGLAIGATPGTNFTYVISTNIPGQVNLIVSSAAPPLDPFAAWRLQYFNCTNLAICPQAAGNADPDGDGISNTNEFLSGTDPTDSLSGLWILSVTRQGADISITWRTAGGRTNIVQVIGTAGYTTNFSDLSGPIIIPGSGDATTNYVDSGSAINTPSRYYRVRLVP